MQTASRASGRRFSSTRGLGAPRYFSRFVSVVTALLVATAGLLTAIPMAQAADVPTTKAPLLQRTDDHVTADDLPTVQINDGYVWAQTMIGTTVYAVGQFSNVRPAGAAVNTNLTARSNILAYNITTGNLITAFAPTVNGVIKAVAASPDGKRIYIGGSFSSVNGERRYNFAALDATTGKLVSGFAPSVGGAGVYALAVTADTVYVGGLFTQGNGISRINLAAFNTSDGALLPWAPTTDLQVDAMVMEPQTGQVIIGGRFYAVNSQVQRGLANLNPVSGAVNTSWEVPNTVKNGWNSGTTGGQAGIFGLATDANSVYGTGWTYNAAKENNGNLEGVFAAEAGSGAIRWVSDCHGDHYGVYSTGSIVYTTDHTHGCETVNLWPDTNPKRYRYIESYTTYANGTLTKSVTAGSQYKDWSGTPSPSAFNWFPDFTVGTTSGLGQAGLSITGNGDYISVGGEYGTVNNMGQQGLTRFATKAKTSPKQGPRVTTASWVPSANSVVSGTARISIPTNWDRDDLSLTYTLRRSGTSQAIASQTVVSTWWDPSTVAFYDRGLTPGQTYTYTVVASDADGNSRTSSPVSVTIVGGTAYPYAEAVLNDNPSLYYQLGGSTLDLAGNNPPFYGADVSTVTPGGVTGSIASASNFTGANTSIVSSSSTSPLTSGMSQELWFKTTGNTGGKLIGYGNKKDTNSTTTDRNVYLTNAGKVVFGVYSGKARTVISPKAYKDGAWHHLVATLGDDGMKLYVDGELVGSNADITAGRLFSGYWRIGGDIINGWPSNPSASYFTGQLNDVAVYSSVLSADQVAAHYAKGKNQTPPTASFATTSTERKAAFDASASTAAAGSLASYAWDFGDGQTSSEGPTTTHTYAAAGTYQVKLTVTDSNGLTGTSTKSVTVQASAYANAVLEDDPLLYYRLGGSSVDLAGSNNPSYTAGVTTVTPGGVVGTNSAASNFAGAKTSIVSSSSTSALPDGLSQEVWFKTTSTSGGKIIGYGSSKAANSGTTCRNVYMTNAGKVIFGVYSGSRKTIASPKSYNDGVWHHMVTTFGSDGMKLYIDGQLVASQASVTTGRSFAGYWRIGGDNLNGWPSRPSSDYFAGQMNDFAIYPSVLSPETIAAHYAKGKDLTAPTAAFAANPTDVQVAFDASASSAAGSASISSYAWDFGDEKTGSEGPTTTHTYAAAGTYQVKLTVTDSNGMTGTSTKSVTVTAPPEEPTVPGVIASDNFNRQIASGWGTADTGGAWTTWTAVASRASVNNGSGKISLPPGYARNLVLRNASPTDSESSVQFSVNGTPAMGDAFAGISARMTDSTSYTVRARMKSDGTVWLVPRRGSTNLPEVQVPGVTWSGNEVFNLKMRVTGTKPTKIEARIWKDGSSEPSVWQLSRTDATAALQSAGYVGLHAAHASGTPGTIEVLFDSFRVVDLGQANN